MKKLISTLMACAVAFIITAQNAYFPKGSVVNQAGSCSVVIPPTGWTYIALLSDNTNYEGVANVTICCDCTSGSGTCLPVGRGNSVGCIMTDGCKSCNAGLKLQDKTEGVSVLAGGYVNFTLGVTFRKEAEELPSIFPEMEKSSIVQKGINEFLYKLYKGAKAPAPVLKEGVITAPTGYKLAAINVYGRGGLIVVPGNTFIPSEASVASGSCSCSQGSCSYFSTLGVYGCKGPCTGTCCMSARKDGLYSSVYYTY